MQKLLCPFCNEPLRIHKNKPNLRMCMRHRIQYDTVKHTCSLSAMDSQFKYIKDSFDLLNKWHDKPPVASFAKCDLFTPDFDKEDVISITDEEMHHTNMERRFHWLKEDGEYKLIQLGNNVSYLLRDYMIAMVGSAGFAEAAFDITRRDAAEFLYYTMIAYNLVKEDLSMLQYNKAVWYACAVVPDLMFYSTDISPALAYDKLNSYLLYGLQNGFYARYCSSKKVTADQFMKWTTEIMKESIRRFNETKPCNTEEYLEQKYPILYSGLFTQKERTDIAKCDDTVYMYSMLENDLCGYSFINDGPDVNLPNIIDDTLKFDFRFVMNQIELKHLLHAKCLKELALALYLVHSNNSICDGTLDSRIKNFWKNTAANHYNLLLQ